MAWKSNRVMWERNSPYAYRDDNLRGLGFKSYRAYLRSDLWMSIKVRVVERDSGKCSRCGGTPKKPQVHHRAYDPATLRGDLLDALNTVCARCHVKAERPADRTRTRHDRLVESSHVLSRLKRGRAHGKSRASQ